MPCCGGLAGRAALVVLCLGGGFGGALLAIRHVGGGAASEAPAPTGASDVAALKKELALMKARQALVALEGAHHQPPALPPKPRTKEESRALLLAALDASLRREPEDETAGREVVALIAEATEDALPGASPESATCNASLCRVLVKHDDPETLSSFASVMLEKDVFDTGVVYFYDRAARPPTTMLYVAREGHALPNPPP